MRLLLKWSAMGIANVCFAVAFVLAAPFVIVGSFFDECANDLAAEWRRGRKQNWLWRWASKRTQ